MFWRLGMLPGASLGLSWPSWRYVGLCFAILSWGPRKYELYYCGIIKTDAKTLVHTFLVHTKIVVFPCIFPMH